MNSQYAQYYKSEVIFYGEDNNTHTSIYILSPNQLQLEDALQLYLGHCMSMYRDFSLCTYEYVDSLTILSLNWVGSTSFQSINKSSETTSYLPKQSNIDKDNKIQIPSKSLMTSLLNLWEDRINSTNTAMFKTYLCLRITPPSLLQLSSMEDTDVHVDTTNQNNDKMADDNTSENQLIIDKKVVEIAYDLVKLLLEGRIKTGDNKDSYDVNVVMGSCSVFSIGDGISHQKIG